MKDVANKIYMSAPISTQYGKWVSSVITKEKLHLTESVVQFSTKKFGTINLFFNKALKPS